MMSSDAEEKASKLKVVPATDSHLRYVMNYKTDRLIHELQAYNEKKDTRTDRYATRIETLMEVYKFDDKDSTTMLCLLAQFKKTCSSNEVSENRALGILPTFKKNRQAYSLTVLVTSYGDKEVSGRLPKADKKQIYTYVEAVNFFC